MGAAPNNTAYQNQSMKPQTDSEWTIHALNIHGAFFERWCREVVDSRAPWHVKYSNYPVEFGGMESNLDLRADRNVDGHLVSLLIECKKPNPDFVDWTFLPRKGVFTGTPLLTTELRPRRMKPGESAWFLEAVIGGLAWNSPVADEARETRGSYPEYTKRPPSCRRARPSGRQIARQCRLRLGRQPGPRRSSAVAGSAGRPAPRAAPAGRSLRIAQPLSPLRETERFANTSHPL